MTGFPVASQTLLLVLIVREAGLRSTLAARLSMAGADVLTADDFGDPRLARHQSRPLVLIADQAAVAGYAGGSEGLAADGRWARLVLVSPEQSAPSGDARLLHVARTGAANAIAQLLPDWQAHAA